MTSFLLLLLLLIQVPAGLQAQTGVVTGILRTDTGLPLGGVRVAVTPADASIADSVLESLGLTDSTGRYRLENVSPGRYNILIGRGNQSTYHPGVTEPGRATSIQVLAGSTIEVSDMVFKGGKPVTGRVVDLATGSGRRMENLILCCDYSQAVLRTAQGGPLAVATLTAYISDDGSFVFPSVVPGNYLLSAADAGVIPVSRALAVGENGVTGLQLEVSGGVEVQGTVLDRTGEPVTASVRLRPDSANSVFNIISSQLDAFVRAPLSVPKGAALDVVQKLLLKSAKVHETLARDGRFAFQKVYPGAYVLEVSTTGVGLLEREIQVGVAGITNVSLQLQAIHVTGSIIARSGAPLPKLNYIRVVPTGVDAQVFYAFPDTDGHFSFLLDPGEYRVFTERLGPSVQSVSDGSRDITNTEFKIDEGRKPQIVVTLEP